MDIWSIFSFFSNTNTLTWIAIATIAVMALPYVLPQFSGLTKPFTDWLGARLPNLFQSMWDGATVVLSDMRAVVFTVIVALLAALWGVSGCDCKPAVDQAVKDLHATYTFVPKKKAKSTGIFNVF